MRIAAQVLLAYVLFLVFGCLGNFLPNEHTVPDVVALCAVYLGLTARQQLAGAALGAVILGYLGDILAGSIRGSLTLTAGVLCIVGNLVHRRLIVRGWLRVLVLSFFAGLTAGSIMILLRAYAGLIPGGLRPEFQGVLYSAAATAAVGPVIFRICRLIDARFARTHRERQAAREGIPL